MRMRKGTKSCTECRRRKIRCIFPNEDCNVCLRCSNRGIQCIDQRLARAQNATGETKTLRERVARLETLLDIATKGSQSVKDTIVEDGMKVLVPDDVSDVTGLSENEDTDINCGIGDAPLLSALGANTLLKTNITNPTSNSNAFPSGYTTPSSTRTQVDISNSFQQNVPQLPGHKSQYICGKLRRALPDYDEIMKIFSERGSWYHHWRQKTFGNTQSTETLSQFAARVYCSDSPEDLGLLVLAYARSITTHQSKYLETIENRIISDNSYASTMKGMECIILQGKCYLDMGRPRRAWMIYRRGLALAQLQNMHRNYSSSPERECIWWSLYQGDRFVSMLLGLPYSVNDAHCNLACVEAADGSPILAFKFVVRCAVVGGKLIDRNQAVIEPPISATMSMDEEMESIAQTMPSSWWRIPSTIEAVEDADGLLKTLLTQVYFFHIRMYLHLPLMIKTPSHSRYEHGKKVCVESARELVKRYHLLRSEINGEDLFDCKTNDFVGFTASVILLLGLVIHSSGTIAPPGQFSEDWRLIRESNAIFKKLAGPERRCRVAKQCHHVLNILISTAQETNRDPNNPPEPLQLYIPYFGSISVTRKLRMDQTYSYDEHHTSSALTREEDALVASGVFDIEQDQTVVGDQECTLPFELNWSIQNLTANFLDGNENDGWWQFMPDMDSDWGSLLQ
ncbi:hypothetical protein F5884DRAFT_803010 [Xylogone sp. PMI_703]|nr:hypothetical protein F5884DRAFT_803010 [Xylogone sp. PMI_703]